MERLLRSMHLIGAGAVLLQSFTITLDIILRWSANLPITGSDEAVGMMMIVVVCFCMGFTQRLKSHVSVKLVYSKLPAKYQRALDLIGYLISLTICGLIVLQCVITARRLNQVGEITPVLHLPTYPMYLLISVGFLAFFLQLARDLTLTFRSSRPDPR